MDIVNLGIIAWFLGGILSVLYPYLVKYLETGESFNWRYAVSRVLAVVIAGLTAIVAPGFVDQLKELASVYDYTTLYFIAVALTTYGAGSLGRETQN